MGSLISEGLVEEDDSGSLRVIQEDEDELHEQAQENLDIQKEILVQNLDHYYDSGKQRNNTDY